MTTIAWDGETLAGDTQRSWGQFTEFVPTKLRRLADGSIFGAAGTVTDIERAVRFIEGVDITPPKFTEDGFVAIQVRPDKSVVYWNEMLEPILLYRKNFAVGTGGPFAMGAMACGYPAEEAVAVAIELDGGSGGEITSMRLNDGI